MKYDFVSSNVVVTQSTGRVTGNSSTNVSNATGSSDSGVDWRQSGAVSPVKDQGNVSEDIKQQ